MRQIDEPSVEEILESIKKVIARDSRVDERVTLQRSMDHDHWEHQSSADELNDEPALTPETDEVLDLAAVGTFVDAEEPEEIGLLNSDAVGSISESLSALAMLSGPGAAPQIVRSGETSLEGLVRELLRPALAEWLDRNLPPLVERMIATEIARIVGKKG